MSKLYGYDKWCKAIYDGSIIKFLDIESGKRKIGHIWYCGSSNEWMISFNHVGSETADYLNRIKIRNIVVIGFSYDDEYLMRDYWQ